MLMHRLTKRDHADYGRVSIRLGAYLADVSKTADWLSEEKRKFISDPNNDFRERFNCCPSPCYNPDDHAHIMVSRPCCFDADEELTPLAYRLADIEDILGAEYDLEALRQLVESHKAGRILPLPCPVGTPVYIIGGKVRRGVFEKWCNNGEFRLSDIEKFGKTVFLTPEEATAAMEKLTEDML